MQKVANGAGMPAADRRHVDDVPLDQLQTCIGREYPGIPHAVIFIHGQPMAPDCCISSGGGHDERFGVIVR